ncbi:MAG: 50S ribosomal protein L24 [Candidatus Eisenbacteria bacterium]|uniref:Large ribosomal subunit protein uL24 n=1 Tax=Eiseniibacteriota bacterium TaxID=2212470 RepID=A0A9D6L7B8_UNCEI|nr:50S ribosomal protein L24 [Candidatus Eisenbacteria bacterium]MBI3538935.1 50S ribosomal protein L24 [Candidatus Eisenbacteria bacterium]
MGIKIRKGDTVVVIAGDDKGTIDHPRIGRVLSVDEVTQRVTVEKVNMVKRHTKARRQGVQSGIVEKEAPIHLSNVMLYDPKAKRGTRIKMRMLPDGSRERVSVVSDESLPKAGA